MKKTVIAMSVCLLTILSFFSGCINLPKELTQFSIVSFDVEPGVINEGEYANLSWAVISASSVNISNGIGIVALTGHRIIQPTENTTYILTALNATTTKSATVTIIVNPVHQTPDVVITDSTHDVGKIDYVTGETTFITSSPYIEVNNLDIIQATYTQQGMHVILTLTVNGVIENRGKLIDIYGSEVPVIIDNVEYTFALSTSKDNYLVSYCNGTGRLLIGYNNTNLTSSNFSAVGNTLSTFFDLTRAKETFSSLKVTSTYFKRNTSFLKFGVVYISDVAPNPALAVSEVFAYDFGSVGVSIQFNARIEPLSGQPPYTCHWDFGDGVTSTQSSPTHVYTEAGYYTYNFTVTDRVGDTDSKTGTITIKSY